MEFKYNQPSIAKISDLNIIIREMIIATNMSRKYNHVSGTIGACFHNCLNLKIYLRKPLLYYLSTYDKGHIFLYIMFPYNKNYFGRDGKVDVNLNFCFQVTSCNTHASFGILESHYMISFSLSDTFINICIVNY